MWGVNSNCLEVQTCLSPHFPSPVSLSLNHPEYRCARAVSTALCVHQVECIEPDCNSHGSCDTGVCSCDPPWVGEGCEVLNCSLTDCSGRGICENGMSAPVLVNEQI